MVSPDKLWNKKIKIIILTSIFLLQRIHAIQCLLLTKNHLALLTICSEAYTYASKGSRQSQFKNGIGTGQRQRFRSDEGQARRIIQKTGRPKHEAMLASHTRYGSDNTFGSNFADRSTAVSHIQITGNIEDRRTW